MVYSSPSLPGALRPPGGPKFSLRLTEVNPVSLRRFRAAPSEDGGPKVDGELQRFQPSYSTTARMSP